MFNFGGIWSKLLIQLNGNEGFPTCNFLVLSAPPSGFISALRSRHRNYAHAGDCPESAMLLRSDLTLRRISSTTQYNFRPNRRHPTPRKRAILHRNMSDQSTNKDVELGSLAKSGDDKDKRKEEPAAPPPPEKPLPGDCCGSGCVRCVWDVYYEELDEYNRLYNNPDCKTPPS